MTSKKFDILESDNDSAKQILENDKIVLENTIKEFETCEFYNRLSKVEIEKIYNISKQRFSWRFKIIDDKIYPLKIYELIKHTCRTRGFINLYKYTSIHAHSNYLAIENFEKTRSKPISSDYTDPLTKHAIYLTSMIICDICKIDTNAQEAFDKLPDDIRNIIIYINDSIKASL